jgi:hypothetical protein
LLFHRCIEVAGAEVLSITGITRTNVSVPETVSDPAESSLDICDVALILTHPGGNDTATVEVWLPISDWKGRFQGTGGGGFSVGFGALELAPLVAAGFSAAPTDGGNLGASFVLLHNALLDGHVNWPLLLNYGSRSIHDMSVVGKEVTQQFCGKSAEYSYFIACSNGGGEGYISAQKYPDDFDGILSSSPAINGAAIGISLHGLMWLCRMRGKLRVSARFRLLSMLVLRCVMVG